MTLQEIKEKYAGGKMSELGMSYTVTSEEEAAKLVDEALPTSRRRMKLNMHGLRRRVRSILSYAKSENSGLNFGRK